MGTTGDVSSADRRTVEFKVLGPLEVLVDGQAVQVSAPKQRTVLAALLLRAGQRVSTARLIGYLWADGAPKDAHNAVQTHVARLRRLVGVPNLIRTHEGGYLLEVQKDRLDLLRFRGLVRRAEGSTGRKATELLREALSLSRGPLLPGIESTALREDEIEPVAVELRTALERRISIDLELGQHADVIGELKALTVERPLEERYWAQLIRALHLSGRRAEALDAFHEFTHSLHLQLRTSPGPELRELHRAVLADERDETSATTQLCAVPRQLPPDVGELVGREGEVERVSRLLTSAGGELAPLVVVSGPPGVGKTALAVRVGHRLADQFPDGQLYVDLHGYSTFAAPGPEQVLARFLRALGVSNEDVPADLRSQQALLRTVLTGRRVLFVLDNAGDPALVRELCRGVGTCSVLITSRDRWRPTEEAIELPLDVLDVAASVRLLESFLTAAIRDEDHRSYVWLAQQCGNLPLALRIAAANLVAEGEDIEIYAAKLSSGDLLDGLVAEGDEQSAVRSAFSLSYRSLPVELRETLKVASLLPGTSFTVELMAAASEAQEDHVRSALDRLASASLVQEVGEGRFHLHDLVRVYGERQVVVEEGEERVVEICVRAYGFYLKCLRRAFDKISPEFASVAVPERYEHVVGLDFTSAADALAWITDELNNLISLVLSAESRRVPEVSWTAAALLRSYFYRTDNSADWILVSKVGLAAARRFGDRKIEASMQDSLGTAHWSAGQADEAVEMLREANEIREALGEVRDASYTKMNLGLALWQCGDVLESAAVLEECLQHFRSIADEVKLPPALVNLAYTYRSMGKLNAAKALYEEALAICRRFDLGIGEVLVLDGLGACQWELGSLTSSMAYLRDSLDTSMRLGSAEYDVETLNSMADVYVDQSLFGDAQQCLSRVLENSRKTGNRRIEQNALWSLGNLCLRRGHAAEAMSWFLSAAEAAREPAARIREASSLVGMAEACVELDRVREALSYARRAATVSAQQGYLLVEGRAFTAFASACLAAGRAGSAVAFGRKALEVHRETGHRPGEARTLRVIGQALFVAGDRAGALEHWERAVEMFAEMGMPEADGVRELLGQAR